MRGLVSVMIAFSIAAGPAGGDASVAARDVEDRSPFVDPELPRAIDDRDMQRYALALNLTEDQVILIEDHFEEYRAAVRAVSAESYDTLMERGREAAMPTESGRPVPEALLRFAECRAEYLERITRPEATLFVEMQMLLTPEQNEVFERVLHDRDRARCHAVGSLLPGGDIDLVRLLDACDLEAEDWVSIDEHLRAYETAIAPYAKERGDKRFAQRIERVLTPDREDRHRIQRSIFRIDKSVQSVNMSFRRVFAQALPTEHAKRFLQEFNRRAFTNIHPDRSAAHDLLSSLVERDDLTAELREFIHQQSTHYEQQYQQVCGRMEQRFMEWREHLVEVESGIINARDRMAYDEHMQELYQRRLALGAALAQRLIVQLKPTSPDAASIVEAYLASLESLAEGWRPA